jgi:hypothetical protein
MKRLFYGALASISSLLMAIALPLAASAQTATNNSPVTGNTIVVTPSNNDNWDSSQSTNGGQVQYVYDPSSPMPSGALELMTDGTTTAKANYMHSSNTALSDITALSYQTKQIAAGSSSFTSGDASYQLAVCLGGVTNNTTCNGFTTLVYEPYQQTSADTVASGLWQKWDVSGGQFWSTRSYTDSTNTSCTTTAGGGGQPFYTLADLNSVCPNAQVVGFGVNVGSNNPSYVIEVDQVVFNQYTYDFQLFNSPTSQTDCKDAGWQSLTDNSGNSFKNQGQCVSYLNTGKNNQHPTLAAVIANSSNKNALYNKAANQQAASNNGGGQVQGTNTTNNTNNTNAGSF